MNLKPLAIAALLGTARSSQATMIDFNSHLPLYDFSSRTILDSGFSFSIGTLQAGPIGVSDLNPLLPTQGAFNGSAYLHFADSFDGTAMTMARVGGGAFTIDSFDLGLSWYVNDADIDSTLIYISGDLEGGGTFSSSTKLGRSFETFSVGRSITELRISMDLQAGGYLSLDNFNLRSSNSVPEPASYALAGLALAGLTSLRLARRARL